VKIKMVFVAGESSDQIYIWLSEKEVLLIDYPAMQDPASFNLDAIKKKIEKMKSLGG